MTAEKKMMLFVAMREPAPVIPGADIDTIERVQRLMDRNVMTLVDRIEPIIDSWLPTNGNHQ